MKNPHVLQVVSQIGPLVRSEHPKGQTKQGPQVDDAVVSVEMLGKIVDLGMTVVAPGDAIIGARSLDLLVFQAAVFTSRLEIARLQKAAPAAATVIIGAIGRHVHKILFTNDRSNHETQIFGNGISIAFAHDLAGILHRKLDLQILVPVGVGFQFALPNPAGVVFVDVLDLEAVGNVEFFQSGPDCKGDVPSLGV